MPVVATTAPATTRHRHDCEWFRLDPVLGCVSASHVGDALSIERPGLAAFPLDLVRGAGELVVLVGSWPSLPPGDGHLVVDDQAVIVPCAPKPRRLREAVAGPRPAWLLVGTDIDEDALEQLVHACRVRSASVRLAMLGPPGDVERCARWVRRGCSVYLASSSTVERVVRCLRLSRRCHVVVVDDCFELASRNRQMQPLARLTRRERDVLRLLRLGLRNRELARALDVAESTVEFHLRNIFEKLAVRNRVEAVERGTALGL